MEAVQMVQGIAAPLMRSHVDTDQIIPTRFLARMSESGLGDGLFAEWATRPDGSRDPAFLLHQSPWDRAVVLVAGPAFGCGSSREAAPRALRQRGFQALVAPSFGDTFFGNCFRNGVVPVRLPVVEVEFLGAWLQGHAGDPEACETCVDVTRGLVSLPRAGREWSFELPLRLREMLLKGLDEVALTLSHADAIGSFRERDRQVRPWAYR